MPMNTIIQEKRKKLGLTQEQVAEYLNVSTPAVSKWEKGSTSPDIALLPSLARLLKIDLNTLFCFQEDMTSQEINCFCSEIADLVRKQGLAAGFEAAQQKLHEYPRNETLLQFLTFSLDGLLTMSGLPSEEKGTYDDMLAAWYRTLSESSDFKIRNTANYMLASRLIRKGDYEQAQEILDLMPDKEDILNSMADKQMLQVIIYQRQGKPEKAAKDLQNALLTALNKVQLLLFKLIDAELASGEMQTAKNIADKSEQMAELFELWAYDSCIAPLQIAAAEKEADTCICILRKMLAAMLTPWDMSSSPLFHRIAKTTGTRHMLPAVLSELERDPAYEFLKCRGEFRALIDEYKAYVKK